MPSPRAMVSTLSCPVPLFIAAVMGWHERWITDDGFIYLRVIRQVTSGHGPVFNTGERVEAFTSPLWVGMMSLADIVTPIRLEWLVVGIGIGLTMAGLVAAMAGADADSVRHARRVCCRSVRSRSSCRCRSGRSRRAAWRPG